MGLSSLKQLQTPVLPISEKLRSENASTQSTQPMADYGSEDLHRHAAMTAALWANSHRGWERSSCSLSFPKASTNSEHVCGTYIQSET